MPKYKLTYFNVTSLGEPIRFLLSYGGADFEDVRIDRQNEWPAIKHTMPFGQVPILEIDGKVYYQTLPICRYLARQFNIGGQTDLDALEIDAIANSVYDLRKLAALYYWEANPDEKAKKRETLVNASLPFYLKKFDEILKDNAGYFHGGELSYADLFFAAAYHNINSFMGFDVAKDYPNLRRLVDKVLALPKIAAWVAKRPKTPY
ncbi:glutathione S-transferase-like [Neodiprion virginianus]|uniref:glutathione S-transferase-like n=1 Tax=Neodiprion virginianus TaxID=2961670 RepID=UPI001EE6CD58|nr:glutathione S-transferase-like [Neodiprion virginianus]XP_046626327.1 glutathione S-transferase-like [Neodiprion virginianus]XP_046626335.1 glutathione S-transferase-like [Neodiprion virginianus]XP_046626344.1 glutathione S-transferase-like [Neodiprion virginianus]